MTTKEFAARHYEAAFVTHKATLIQDTDRYFAADYRRADGRSINYINFIVDKERGSLIISGDLGDCIATWYNPLTPQKLNSYIRNNEYCFAEKVQCSTVLWRYNSDKAYREICNMLAKDEEDFRDFDIPDIHDLLSQDEFWDELREEVNKSYAPTEFHPTERLQDLVETAYHNSKRLYRCGRSLDLRIYLWLYAFDDVCRQIFGEGSAT